MTNPADGYWGIISEEDGTWSGMVGETATGHADVIISDILVNFVRLQVIELILKQLKVT